MFRIKRLLLNFIIMFFVCNNNVYATTTGNYVVESNQSGIEKIIFLLIAIGLVAAVLFFGYKMDQDEEKNAYKENTKKNNLLKQTIEELREEVELENPYKLEINENESNIINESNIVEEESYEKELMDNIIEDDTLKFSKMLDINDNIEDLISQIEKLMLQKEVHFEDEEDNQEDDEVIVKDDEDLIDEKELTAESIEEDDTKTINIEIEENEDIKDVNEVNEENKFEDYDKTEEIESIQEIKTNPNLNIFTKVLNSFGSKENDFVNDKQDFEEDLLDIKKLIADANIKRYTRKINHDENKADKKFIENEINKQKSKVKRYTRKIVREVLDNSNEYKIQFHEELAQKPKRGRPRKEDMPKPKRGRPKKTEQKKRGRPKKVEPKKRGRPRKEDTEKPKRGRPKKNS